MISSESNPRNTTPRALLQSRTAWMLGGMLIAVSLAAGAGMMSRQPADGAKAADAKTTATPQKLAATNSPSSARTPAATAGRDSTAADGEPTRVAAAPPAPKVCASCGTVESVQAVKNKGEAQGVGAVAGGVLGAVVGNQMGKGDGRKAMTVLGAIGGGVAGHEVEKHARSTTVHVVQLRMDDGTRRTLRVAQAPRPGERVRVEGSTLRPIAGTPDQG